MRTDGFADRLAAAIVRVRDRAAGRIAADLPEDVTLRRAGRGLRITGRRLAWRALTDARLRDFGARGR